MSATVCYSQSHPTNVLLHLPIISTQGSALDTAVARNSCCTIALHERALSSRIGQVQDWSPLPGLLVSLIAALLQAGQSLRGPVLLRATLTDGTPSFAAGFISAGVVIKLCSRAI